MNVATATIPMMTWSEAVKCFVNNVEYETNGFQQVAGRFRAVLAFLAFAGIKMRLIASGTMFLDNLLLWIPGLNVFLAGNDVLAWGTVAGTAGFMGTFLAYASFRVYRIRSKANRIRRRHNRR